MDKLQRLRIRLPVDQDQIRLDMAIALIAPVARARMVSIAIRQDLVASQRSQDPSQVGLQRRAMDPFPFPFVVTLKTCRPLNPPH
jgi:hypothetical protein